MLVTYVDRCSACSCSSLRDEGGRRPVPGLSVCEGCRCHGTNARSARATYATLDADVTRYRLLRRMRRAAHAMAVTAAT